MAIYLNVPEEEQEEARASGALWDERWHKFYVNNADECPAISKWMLEDDEKMCSVVRNQIYILEGWYTCKKCGAPARVICFMMKDEYVFTRNGSGEIECTEGDKLPVIRPAVFNISSRLETYLEREYNYKLPYSYYYNKYMNGGNCCRQCGNVITDFELTRGTDPLFYKYAQDQKLAKQLVMRPIALDGDVKVIFDDGNPTPHCKMSRCVPTIVGCAKIAEMLRY